MRTSKNKIAIMLAVFLAVLMASQAFAAHKVEDADMTYWVKDAFLHDPLVDASKITVSTKKGIVTLSGSVDNLASKKYADLEAKKIRGVLGVVNKIGVTPSYRSDADIRNAVRRRILNSAVIESQRMTVTCLDGKVTLAGTVDSWSESEQAGLLASEVRGVKDVKNDIWLEYKTERSDQEIKNDAVAQLKRDVYLSGLPITVTVKDGVITLSGSVGNAYEKDLADSEVRYISHVKNVKNKLKVEWWENRGARKKKTWPSNDALKKAVWAELDQDTRVDALDITINVSDGHVTLNGSVANYYQKRIAGKDVRNVVGVAWVTDNLFTHVEKREDWAIRDDVQFNLDTDYILESFALNTKVIGGIVTVTGDVNTWYEKMHAGDVAVRVRGVKEVVNEITVHRNAWKQDAQLVKTVKSRLMWNWSTFKVYDKIGVTVKDGVVTLTGDVNTWSERKEAGRVALHTKGVWEVDNQLTVDGYDYPWDEYHYKWSYYEPQIDLYYDYY
jgi:osmotically-inducible protein OsmY